MVVRKGKEGEKCHRHKSRWDVGALRGACGWPEDGSDKCNKHLADLFNQMENKEK